jgi:hypothetical protein
VLVPSAVKHFKILRKWDIWNHPIIRVAQLYFFHHQIEVC